MERHSVQPIYVEHGDLPSELDTRDLPLIICETVNELVRNNVDGAQNRDCIWSIWIKSQEARMFLIREVKFLIIRRQRIKLHDAYPIIQTRYPSEKKFILRDLPFDVDDVDILDYLYSQPDIHVKNRNLIHARIRNKKRELTPFHSGERFFYMSEVA